MAEEISLTLNGRVVEGSVEPRKTLVDFLRHDCGTSGVRAGCEHGACGACTVVVDGATARSCLMFAVSADGSDIQTVESMGEVDALHPLQQSFIDHHAFQCGFCTSGMLLTMREFLDRSPDPDAQEIREALAGSVCRCTGYQFIVDAVLDAAGRLRGEAPRVPVQEH